MLCGDLEGWDGGGREAQEGGDRCICIADSLYFTLEANTTLQTNYTPIKKSIFSLFICDNSNLIPLTKSLLAVFL